jgi:hypothetical protein
VLACGDGALLSGSAAAYLWGILKGRAPMPEVTAPTERSVKGIKTHRSLHMDPRDTAKRCGIPITTIPRTIVDIAPDLTLDELAPVCHEAGVKYKTTHALPGRGGSRPPAHQSRRGQGPRGHAR